MKANGIILKAGVKTLNGRLYPLEVLKKAVEDFNASMLMDLKVGMIGPNNLPHVMLQLVSHKIDSLYMDGDLLKVDIDIYDTEQGKTLISFMKDGHEFVPILVGNSLAGDGNDGTQIITDLVINRIDVCPYENRSYEDAILNITE